MSKKKAVALYDFNAENEGELPMNSGDEFTILDETTYDGWYYVSNRYGSEGIVPSSYCKVVEASVPPAPMSMPQPSFTPAYEAPKPSFNSSWDSAPTYANTSSYQHSGSFNDDSDFDDESGPSHPPSYNQTSNDRDKYNTIRSGSNVPATMGNGAPKVIHKPKNQMDAFLFIGPIKPLTETERNVTIFIDEQGLPQWQKKSPAYTISVPSVSSGKKFQGLKQYTTYVLQINSHQVSRRYKQFDWLHERLAEKFPNICVPSLPDKAVTGRFEEEFIKKRQVQLEMWLNRMSMHPVVGNSEVFTYFLYCKDNEEKKWKEYKRKQEKDEYRGAQWLCTINAPQVNSGTNATIKERIDRFSKSAINMENVIKNLMGALDKVSYTHYTVYKKEMAFMGKSFEQLSSCICSDVNTPANAKLADALLTTGNIYTDISNSYGEQAKNDINPLQDQMQLYRYMLQQMPDIVNLNKSAILAVEEAQSRPERQDMQQLNDATNRLNVVNYATLAEINFFHAQKLTDFNAYTKEFLNKQILFYSEIVEKLKKAVSKYD